MSKKMIPIVAIVFTMIALLVGVLYAAVMIGKIPINLPFIKAEAMEYVPEEGLKIAKQWESVKVYEVTKQPESIPEIIEEATVDEKTEADLKDAFDSIEISTLTEYIESNKEVIDNGYEKLFIDKVDLDNTPTGMKTVHGDDVLAVDMLNGITIVGINIPYGEGKVAKAKLAIVNNKEQLDFSVVEDLSYWDKIETHVKESKAILGINANGYTWNQSGSWATMYGLGKRQGELIRKAKDAESAICFDKSGLMTIGTSIDSAWNATEYGPILIKQGETVYSAEGDPEANVRMAQTAIGQTSDGKTLLLVASGGIYGSDNGAIYSEMLEIMEKYKATNASMLASGSRTVMFWNDRVVTKNDGYDATGVLLPTAIVIKPFSVIEVVGSETGEVEKVEGTENEVEKDVEKVGEAENDVSREVDSKEVEKEEEVSNTVE